MDIRPPVGLPDRCLRLGARGNPAHEGGVLEALRNVYRAGRLRFGRPPSTSRRERPQSGFRTKVLARCGGSLSRKQIGLLTDITDLELAERVRLIRQNRDRIRGLITDRPEIFHVAYRPALESDQLVLYRHLEPPDAAQPPTVHPRLLFERFLGPDAWTTGNRDGNIIGPDVLAYLDHFLIRQALEWEFGLYRWHETQLPMTARQGWMRHMLHSVIQQLV